LAYKRGDVMLVTYVNRAARIALFIEPVPKPPRIKPDSY
jgi:hypothetical protein